MEQQIFEFFTVIRYINRCTNKNVDCIKLIKLSLFEGIKANLFALSACGLIQSLPRTRVGKH